MNGEIINDGWKSEAVKQALDLCLSCKGCKGDCPVNVDMAKYKAEFLSHYHQAHLRPRHAHAFGRIHTWAHLASLVPSLANFFTQTPGLRAVARFVAGVDPHREIPPFAPQTFKSWFRSRGMRDSARPDVILFPDTFNNYFHPDVAIAALEVLESAGFSVHVPMQNLCCGRPLYDYGFLDLARQRWTEILRTLRPYIRAGVPMVVLEPSCWAAFKDELPDMVTNSPDAPALRALTFTLSDFLRLRGELSTLPKLARKALVHGHCHQKALDKLNDKELGKLFAEKAVFDAMGLEHREPDSGCCGMAGAFGYEKQNGHYDVSVACGERVLLPEVRQASPQDIIIADGFSCQEQIAQNTDRTALHSAQVLRMAIETDLAPLARPESAVVKSRKRAQRAANLRLLAATTAVASFALLGWRWLGRRGHTHR
jgi:Fe-S oxidoreductase